MTTTRDEYEPLHEPAGSPAGGQFMSAGGGGGGGATTEKEPGEHPMLGTAKEKHAEITGAYLAAKAALAEAKKGGDAEKIAAANKLHLNLMHKASSAKLVVQKLSGTAAPKVEAPKAAPAPTPAPPVAPAAPPQPIVHPMLASATEKHAAAVKVYYEAKAALGAAKSTGDPAKIAAAEKLHKQLMLKASSAKMVVQKLTGQHSSSAKPAATPAPAPAPVQVAPHLAKGSTVKVLGKTAGGGPLVGTVLAGHTQGQHSLVLQLGAVKAEWHTNASLASHTTNSAWAKEQEQIGQQTAQKVSLAAYSSSTDKPVNMLTLMPQAVQAQHFAAENAALHSANEAKIAAKTVQVAGVTVTPDKAGPDLAKQAPHVWGAVHYDEWKASLKGKENSAVAAYTGSAYQSINPALRAGGNHELAQHIDSALAKAPGTPHELTLTRGVSGSFPVEVGGVYHDKGYMSTSLSNGFGGNNKFVITAPKGSKGAYLVQSQHSSEKEFLLPRGSQLHVTKVEHIGGVRHIHANLLPDVKLDAAEQHEGEWKKLTEEEMARLVAAEPPEADLSRNEKFNSTAADLVLVKK